MADGAVNHPKHYQVPGGRAVIREILDVIEIFGLDFNLGNAVKYISRAGKKAPEKGIEDLKKAQFYLNRALSNREVGPPWIEAAQDSAKGSTSSGSQDQHPTPGLYD